MAEHVTTYLNTNGGASVVGDQRDYCIETELQFSTGATGDFYYAAKLLAGHRLLNVTCEVTEATGETCTATVGTYSDTAGTEIDADGFDASTNLNATAGTLTTGVGGTDAQVTAGGYLNTTGAAAYVALVLTVAATPLGTAGKMKVRCYCRDETTNI